MEDILLTLEEVIALCT